LRCTSTSSTSSSACSGSSALAAISGDDAALPIGLLPERDELVEVPRSRQGLTVVVADPWSGASAVLAAAARAAGGAYLLVDARRCSSSWALADPLLAAWAREHAPPWARRATAYSSAASSSGSVTGR
jgi:hypothetical protein